MIRVNFSHPCQCIKIRKLIAMRGAGLMSRADVFVVMLRRPRRSDPRSDPYYEFGSFGLTGCHSRNLLNPRKARTRLARARLAFVQGGNLGVRLICLTPPVTVVIHPVNRVEVRWKKQGRHFRFLKYDGAPEITRIPALEKLIRAVDRTTMAAKFSSVFRSRTTPLPAEVAAGLELSFSKACRSPEHLATRYEETLPILVDDNFVERNRKQKRREHLRTAIKARPCHPTKHCN
jgi:hypothetical protein